MTRSVFPFRSRASPPWPGHIRAAWWMRDSGGLQGAGSGNAASVMKDGIVPSGSPTLKMNKSKRRDQEWRGGEEGDGGEGEQGALSDICIFKLGIELRRNVVIIHPQLLDNLHWITAWTELWSDLHLLYAPAIMPPVHKYLCWSL